MSGHKKIQILMYEYLRDELPPDLRAAVESHSASCSQCREELKLLRAAIELIPVPSTQPSEQRTPEFWQTFASRIEALLHREGRERKKFRPSLWEMMESAIMLRPGFATAAGGVLALLGVAVVSWHLYTRVTPEVRQPQIVQPVAESSPQQLNQYFSKSKVLLVGLTNLKAPEGEPVDLSAERRASRQLLEETKSLRRQPLDSRSVVLVNDLEKIFNELANAKQGAGARNVEFVRNTIRQENLLFKIRMAERLNEPARFVRAADGDADRYGVEP